MAGFGPDTHWRDAARPARFWFLDANACFPVFIFLVHISWGTLIFAIVTSVFFSLLTRRGFTMVIFGRWVRTLLAGPRKIAQPWWL